MDNNVVVVCKIGDLNNNGILYSGSANYQEKDNVFLLKYVDDDNVENKIRFSNSSCIVYRKGEDELKIYLSTKRESYIEVKTSMGWLKIPIETKLIYSRKGYMKVIYSIPQAVDQDAEFEFTWEIQAELS